MAYYSHSATFDKGWTSPLLGSRSDVDFWLSSLSYCVNFNVLTHGGLRRRSGTRFIAEVADSSQFTRLLPFRFSEDQSYIIAFNGNGSVRFISERAQLFTASAPYQISHSYNAAALAKLSYTQFNDVAYMAQKSSPPRKLLRMADINWSLVDAVFDDGPYMDRDVAVSTTLTPGGLGSPTIAATASSSNLVGGYLEYTLSSAEVIDAYWLKARPNFPGDSPTGWKFSGWNGSTWVALDSRDGEAGWAAGKRSFYEINNKSAYTKYRFDWDGPQSTSAENVMVHDARLHISGDHQTPTTLTANSTDGINGGGGFKSTDVGRPIRIKGASGRWIWVRIQAVTSSTLVTVKIYEHALVDKTAIGEWQMGAFSRASGFPGCVALFNERLMWARTNTQPVTVFGSKQGAFDDYGQSNTPVETDGISITLLSSNQNEILWLADDEDIVTGSSGQIRTVGPSDLNKSFSAINITQRKGPTSGAAQIQPLSIGGVTLYAGAGATKIRELVLGDQNRYVAPELSLLGEHLFKTSIQGWAFCERPDPTIYCVMGDGSLVSVAYDREQKVVGFAKHEIASGTVESVAVIPSPEKGYDDLYMVVRRTINGQVKRYIEVLERPFDGEIDAVEAAFHVDCGLSYSGAEISTITGLGHLEGETVVALADGSVVPNLVVTGGSVTLPFAASKISIGLRYKSRAVTQPVAGPQQDGTLFGRNRTITAASLDVLHSGAAKVGTTGSGDWTPPLYEQLLKTSDTLFGNSIELRTGFVPCDVEGSWMQGDAKLAFETDEPLPLLVRSLVLQLESTP